MLRVHHVNSVQLVGFSLVFTRLGFPVFLQVYDVDNIIGLVQSETIAVHAEAYDVALDMSFPRGADGGIDLDVSRVGDEARQQCSLKNRGKYDIVFSYVQCLKSVRIFWTMLSGRGSPVVTSQRDSWLRRSQPDVKRTDVLACHVEVHF